jgi:hypothetical protein
MERVLLVVDEWNYDNGVNLSAERRDRVFVSAAYIPSRMKQMYEAGIDYQVFFSLEDFQYNKEGIERNVGAFWFTPDPAAYNGGAKSTYNVMRQLSLLGSAMFVHAPKLTDEFVGVIATKEQDRIALLVYNYIDQDIFRNYLSRNIGVLKEGERRQLLGIIKSDKLDKIMRRQLDAGTLQVSGRIKTMLKKAQELNDSAARFSAAGRNIKIGLKNLKEEYIARRYTVDSACNSNCELLAQDLELAVSAGASTVSMALNPYSVNLVVLTKKSKEILRPQEIDKALEQAAQKKEPAREQDAAKQLEENKAESPKDESMKPEALKPESVKPESPKAEISKPESQKPENAKLETVKPDSAKTETPKQESARPDKQEQAKTGAPLDQPKAGVLTEAPAAK